MEEFTEAIAIKELFPNANLADIAALYNGTHLPICTSYFAISTHLVELCSSRSIFKAKRCYHNPVDGP